MIALDSSVVIAAFATWHASHQLAVEVVESSPRIVAHAVLETFSVLTRLPPPHRAQPGIVRDFLQDNFPEPYLALPAEAYRNLVGEFTRKGITGGAVYDALVAESARRAGANLLSLDRRAASIYRPLGVDFEILG